MRKHSWVVVLLLLLIPAAALAAASLTAIPDSLTFSARCVRTSAGRQTVSIDNTGDQDAKAVTVTISPSPMASIFPLRGTTAITSLGPDDEPVEFSVGFTPGKAGAQDAAARIDYRSGDSEGSPRATSVPLAGEGIDRFIDVSPRALNFGDRRIGSDAPIQRVTIFDDGASPLRVKGVTIVGQHAGDFTVRPRGARTLSESSPLTLTVGFTPHGVGARSARLKIRSNSCEDSTIEVDLAGTGVTPDIVALPAELDFGVQEPGARATRAVTVANQGGASLVVESIRLRGDELDSFLLRDVPTLPRTLSPGTSLEFRIRFSAPAGFPQAGAFGAVPGDPLGASTLNALLRVASTDGDSPILRVPISATIQEASALVSPSPAESTPTESVSPSPAAVGSGPSIADFGAEARVIALVLAFFGLMFGVRRVRGVPD